MRELFYNACYGPGSYFQSNHMIVLALGVLLYFFLADSRTGPAERRLLRVTAVMAALSLFPVSAVALMLYQTRFYAYHWIWSLTPVTLCIAWGSVELLWELTAQRRQDGRAARRLAAGMAALLALLLLTGNLGDIRTVTQEERMSREELRQTVACLEETPGAEETLLWAPRSVLEEVRRRTGDIRLLYGRNMWEPEAAAYAYDVYPPQQQRLFDWMEALERPVEGDLQENLREDRVVNDAYMLHLAAEYDARLWVFPQGAQERVTQASGQLYEEYGLRASQLSQVGGYIVWSCE